MFIVKGKYPLRLKFPGGWEMGEGNGEFKPKIPPYQEWYGQFWENNKRLKNRFANNSQYPGDGPGAQGIQTVSRRSHKMRMQC